MQKLLKIGQVSALYGISPDTLRYYDRKGLLKPIVDTDTGYRYYSLEHLDVLEMILIGRYLEIPLEHMKQKIASENIDEYVSMLDEQHRRIEEQRAFLERLSLYTEDMADMLTHMKGFHNDPTFSQAETETHIDDTLYFLKLKDLFDSTEVYPNAGIEDFEQWFTYHVDEDGNAAQDDRNIGFSAYADAAYPSEAQTYLDSLVKAGKATEAHMSGAYRHINFRGTEPELQDYLHLACKHFDVTQATINVKFRFALLHENMQHEYFAEIYFPSEGE